MGKKGSWFSAIKRVFTHSSKETVADGTEKKSSKEKKKKGLGKLKHGDGHSFIPFFRGPSTIEEIFGEAEKQHNITSYKPPQPTPPSLPLVRTAALYIDDSPRASTSLRTYSTPIGDGSPPSQRVPSPPRDATPINVKAPAKALSSRFVHRPRPEPTLKDQHICATKIQAAYRGYWARRNYRALRGLVRLQAVVTGQSVNRQIANTLKSMQLMVHVQNEIHSRRIQMLENQAQQRLHKNDKDGAFGNWNLFENSDEWDDSTLTKEEIDTRMQRRVDAIVKRERALAYAYSHHQSWKAAPGVAQSALTDIRSRGFPYRWNWLDQRNTPSIKLPNPYQSPSLKTPQFTTTPTRSTHNFKTSPLPTPSNLGHLPLGFDNMDTPTPRSTKSAAPSRVKTSRTPPGRLQRKFKQGNPANSPYNGGTTFKDDDSLMSCPPFSVPHYMAPTQSAKAKVRIGEERIPDSPVSTVDETKRRVSFPFGQVIGSSKWKNKYSGSQKGSGGTKNKSVQSLGDHLSVDSSVSMPAIVGRKPFNRFA